MLPLLMMMLAACQLALPGSGAKPPAAATIRGDAITTTSLDAPGSSGPDSATTTTGPQPDGTATADTPRPKPRPEPKPRPGQAQPAAEPTPPVVAQPAIPEPLKSAAQIVCERKGGRYANAGKSGAKTCIRQTRDAGKQCRKAGDCEGACLARSQSCAPITPLFGCNDILQNDGRQVTLCID
ncbi:MAG: hypothetical protein U1D35_18450 [Paracoccaceae bacterium]|nr:hypothetical protein [Paracoccaceae bacterium]